MNEKSWSGVAWKRSAELLSGPRSRRMIGDGMYGTAALVREDDEPEQEPARRSRHDEEIRGDLLKVVRKERAPRL